jgi:uncharacterized protein YerC
MLCPFIGWHHLCITDYETTKEIEMKKIESAVADKVKEMRNAGATYREISEKTGVSNGTILRLCKKRTPLTKGKNFTNVSEKIIKQDEADFKPSYQYLEAKNKLLSKMLQDALSGL